VVDNEQVDRELIVNILTPLGFEVAEASTGQECLDIYQTFKPDAILMDLAMPIMDGWEASYIIKKIHLSTIPIAIVSANAFDKNLENSAGIAADDFIVKPVNVEELLNWFGDRLQIDWVTSADFLDKQSTDEADETPVKDQLLAPSKQELASLLAMVKIGYIKGIHRQLDQLVERDQKLIAFAEQVRELSNQFQLNEMKHYIENFTHE
jgi:CheY-like chemotaxis protein